MPHAATDSGLLRKAIAVTLGAQALVVLASLVLPVAASVVLPALGLPPHVVGWYASLIFLGSAVATLATPPTVARHGAARVHQGMLVLAAAGLLALAAGGWAMLAVSAVLIGLAYGPANPASSPLLQRLAPPERRARVFSLKQVAVPLGGAAAGVVVPGLAVWLGWRGTALWLALVLLMAAAVTQRWRRDLDVDVGGGGPRTPLLAPFEVLRGGGPAARIAAAALCFAAVQFTFSSFLPTVLVQAGWSVPLAGATLTVALAVSVFARIALGWVADRLGATRVLLGLGLAMACACLAGATIGPAMPVPAGFLVAAMFGFAAFGWNGVMLAEAARVAPPGRVAAATAGTMMMVYAGATLGPALFGTAFAALGGPAAGFLLLAGFGLAPALWLRGAAAQSIRT
jgi:MFS family permease